MTSSNVKPMDAPTHRKRFSYSAPANELVLADVRSDVGAWLGATRANGSVGEISLVLTELLTNAREAAGNSTEISVTIELQDQVLLTVTNVGGGFQTTSDMPTEMARRGRGLAIVEAMSDSVSIDQIGDLTTVIARLGF